MASVLVLMLVAGCSEPGGNTDVDLGQAMEPRTGTATSGGVPTTGEDDSDGRGKHTYGQACFSCHQAGLVGAPRLGDKDAWAERIDKGMDLLVVHAIEGFTGDSGVMPAKGGHPYLSDREVEAAVRYMIDAVRRPGPDE